MRNPSITYYTFTCFFLFKIKRIVSYIQIEKQKKDVKCVTSNNK